MDFLYSLHDALVSISGCGCDGAGDAKENDLAQLDMKFEVLRLQLKQSFDAFERRFTFRFGLMFFTGVGITIALIRLRA